MNCSDSVAVSRVGLPKLALRLSLLLLLTTAGLSVAAAEQQLLRDRDGDGAVRALAFGDSITYGVGSSYQPGEYVEDLSSSGARSGYPNRLTGYLGIPIVNSGEPGELLTGGGVERFASKVVGRSYDIVFIMEGTNDAFPQTAPIQYAHSLQKMINVAVADGKAVVVMTVAPTSGLHSGLMLFTEAYSQTARELAAVNRVALVDVERGLTDACGIVEDCQLFLQPEGLHPNAKGYDALAQLVAARLVGVDITAPGSASQLASALGIPAVNVLVGSK
jgi:lysophospholipase L1-like esterase